MRKTFLLPLLFPVSLLAQNPTIQDCLGAIPICQQIYSESVSAVGTGNFPNEINANINCTVGELNSIWYTFTVANSGDFGFLITPNNLGDDYDWTLFDITNATCEDIFNDPSLVVSCNAAGGGACDGLTGATGASMFAIQGAGCNANPPSINLGFSAFNDLVPVIAGNTYVLMVSNWTGSPFGYTIDFGLSTGIGIIDNLDPFLESMETPDECFENTIDLTFSEYIQCSTLSEANFQLTGPGGPFTLTLTGSGCSGNGGFSKDFTLSIDPPISSLGSYTLDILINGPGEGLDLCDNPLSSGSFPFEVDVPLSISVDLGNDTSLQCVGDTLFLNAFNPGGSYSWQDGSTDSVFTVTASGLYTVTVTNACGSGTDEIEVVFLLQPPVIDLGANAVLCPGANLILDAESPFSTYLWQDGSTNPTLQAMAEGDYAVTVANVCGSTTDMVFVNQVPALNLNLPPQVIGCEGDTIALDATQLEATYLWQNGQTNPILQISSAGTYTVTVETLCESVTQSSEVSFIQEEGIELGPDTLICPGDTFLLDATLPGATYLWQDGSTDAVYVVSQAGLYEVEITTVCNVFTDNRLIDVLPPIQLELGPYQYLCENAILLDASSGTQAEYFWQDGATNPLYTVEKPGEYIVTVSNACEVRADTVEIRACENCAVYFPNVFTPDFDGINDYFQPVSDCDLLDFHLIIVDRWGNLVYESRDAGANGWDGTHQGRKVSSGAYVWMLEYRVIENEVSRSEVASGDIVVLR